MDNLTIDHAAACQSLDRQVSEMQDKYPGLLQSTAILIDGETTTASQVPVDVVEQYLALLNEVIDTDLRAMEQLDKDASIEAKMKDGIW